jgi:hypothetical protein
MSVICHQQSPFQQAGCTLQFSKQLVANILAQATPGIKGADE